MTKNRTVGWSWLICCSTIFRKISLKIIVDWGNDSIWINNSNYIYQNKTAVLIDSKGKLKVPEADAGDGSIKSDTIKFKIYFADNMTGLAYRDWKVEGIKTK